MSTATFNLSVPRSFLKRVDKIAARQDRSRSEFVRAVLLDHVQRQERWDAIFAYADRQAKRHGIKPEDVNRAIHEYRRRK